MLEPVRQYGRERLEESDEEEQVRERHASHYLALAEAAETELMGPRAPAGGSPDILTPRQREVALLVARGLTNHQVAAELMLSEHTVATHVRETLKKLGFQSRTEVTAWITEEAPFLSE